ncbi:MAG: nuclear transport factor 2 family protein [Chitinophagaceae bacterium]
MKYFFILLTLTVCGNFVKAQSAEDSVKAVINKMFTAMKNADGEMLKSSFSDSIVFQTISRNKGGATVVRNESASGFINQISKATSGSLDERITFETIKIDGPLASAWTPYSFYYNNNFSHCGVNSFQLVRFDGVWKIQYIIDTRRKDNCVKEK